MGAAVVTAEPGTMDTTSMMDMMLVVMYIGCGLYSLYSYYMQRKSKVILANKVMCPNGYDPQKCVDVQAFLQFMMPRLLVFGIALVLFGGLFVLDHYFGKNNAWLTVVLIFLPLVFLAWYVLQQRKAAKRFW